jgi:hypothetical protein
MGKTSLGGLVGGTSGDALRRLGYVPINFGVGISGQQTPSYKKKILKIIFPSFKEI